MDQTEMPTPAAPPPPRPEAGFFAWVRSLGFVRGDGWIAGVCAAIARRTGTDPAVIRGMFAVAAVLGFPAIWLYAIGWALLPDEDGRVVARLREGSAPAVLGVAITAGFAVIAGWTGASILGAVTAAAQPGRFVSTAITASLWLAAIGAVIIGATWLVRRQRARRGTARFSRGGIVAVVVLSIVLGVVVLIVFGVTAQVMFGYGSGLAAVLAFLVFAGTVAVSVWLLRLVVRRRSFHVAPTAPRGPFEGAPRPDAAWGATLPSAAGPVMGSGRIAAAAGEAGGHAGWVLGSASGGAAEAGHAPSGTVPGVDTGAGAHPGSDGAGAGADMGAGDHAGASGAGADAGGRGHAGAEGAVARTGAGEPGAGTDAPADPGADGTTAGTDAHGAVAESAAGAPGAGADALTGPGAGAATGVWGGPDAESMKADAWPSSLPGGIGVLPADGVRGPVDTRPILDDGRPGDAQFEAWRSQQETWRGEHGEWREQQVDAERHAAEVERARRRAEARAFAQEVARQRAARRASRPRISFAFGVAVIGLAIVAGALTALFSLQDDGWDSEEYRLVAAMSGALFAAGGIAAVGMIVAGFLRGRSGALAALAAVSLVAGGGLALGVNGVLGVNSWRTLTVGEGSQSVAQAYGSLDLWLQAGEDGSADGSVSVERRGGFTQVTVLPDVAADLRFDVAEDTVVTVVGPNEDGFYEELERLQPVDGTVEWGREALVDGAPTRTVDFTQLEGGQITIWVTDPAEYGIDDEGTVETPEEPAETPTATPSPTATPAQTPTPAPEGEEESAR